MCGCASFLLTSHNALFCISLTHTHTHTYAHTNCLYVSIHPSLTLSSHPALCRVAPTQNGVAAHISTPEPLGSRLEAAEAALEEVREKIAALQAVEVKLAREAATLAAEQSEEQPRESSGMAVPSMIRTETVDDDALAVHDMVMAQRRERELYGRSNDDNDNDDDDDDGGGGGGDHDDGDGGDGDGDGDDADPRKTMFSRSTAATSQATIRPPSAAARQESFASLFAHSRGGSSRRVLARTPSTLAAHASTRHLSTSSEASAELDVDLVMQTGLKPVSESAVEGEDSGEALQLHAGVGDWTPAHVFEWMHKSGLGVIAPLAIHKHVDGEQLLRLTEDAAVDLGVGDPVLAGIFARKAQGLASLAQNQ